MKNIKTKFIYLFVLACLPVHVGLSQPTQISRDIPDNVEITANIEYARYGDRSLLLDLYRPQNNNETLPVILVIRGAGWLRGDKEGFGPIAAALAKRGFAAVSIEYRTSNEAKFPAAVNDTKAAVRWIRANAEEYSFDSDKIGVLGGSAGGHLATYLAVTSGISDLEGDGGNKEFSSGVSAVVAFAPITGLVSNERTCGDNPRNAATLFLGATCSEDSGLYVYASPTTHVTENSPPLLLIHSNRDAAVPFQQSLQLAKAYGDAGILVELNLIPDAPHAFWNFENWFDSAMDKSADFFNMNLKY